MSVWPRYTIPGKDGPIKISSMGKIRIESLEWPRPAPTVTRWPPDRRSLREMVDDQVKHIKEQRTEYQDAMRAAYAHDLHPKETIPPMTTFPMHFGGSISVPQLPKDANELELLRLDMQNAFSSLAFLLQQDAPAKAGPMVEAAEAAAGTPKVAEAPKNAEPPQVA